MKRRLTDRQLEVFAFVREYFRENDQLPAASDLAGHFGWTDASAGRHFLCQLTNRGYLERNASGGYRFAREQEASHV